VDREIEPMGQRVLRATAAAAAASSSSSSPSSQDPQQGHNGLTGTEAQGQQLGQQASLSSSTLSAGWLGSDNPWTSDPEGEAKEEDYTYVNLLKNPERYTG
jgi:hypothetical protein